MKVRKKQCSSCIYFPQWEWDIERLEDACKDAHGHFEYYRQCHHHDDDVCCRGFYNRHKDNCTNLQLAQRLGVIEFVGPNPQKEKELGFETDRR